jgi:hypothetical protein
VETRPERKSGKARSSEKTSGGDRETTLATKITSVKNRLTHIHRKPKGKLDFSRAIKKDTYNYGDRRLFSLI